VSLPIASNCLSSVSKERTLAMLMMMTNAERASLKGSLVKSPKVIIASVAKLPKIKTIRVVLKPSSVL